MIKFVYFDFGGVLVNYDDVYTKVCRDFNLDRDEFGEFYRGLVDDMDVGKVNVNEFWNKCIENFGIKNAENYNLAKSWVSDYKIIKPVQDLIYAIEKNVGVGIISNISAETWWAALEDNWVPNIKYNETILSSDVGLVKPDKKIYEIAQKRLENISPSEILFIDDKPENLVEPTNLGWKTFCFKQENPDDGIQRINELLSNS